MAVSLNYLLSSIHVETLSCKPESGSRREDEGGEIPAPHIPMPSFIFSNLGCSMVLEMLANGAEPGKTAQQVLINHFHGKPLDWINEIVPYTLEFFTETGKAGGPKINFPRIIWVDRSIVLKPDFWNKIHKFYNPIVSRMEFGTKDALKSENWIENKTGKLIEDFLNSSDIGADARLIFTSALEFEGEWFEPFESAGVQQFTRLDGNVVSLPFMTTSRKHYVKQFKNYKLLSVPFKQKEPCRFSMLFFLPDHKEDFGDLLSFIGREEISILRICFPEEKVPVGDFLIPKFSVSLSGFLPLKGEHGEPFDFPEMANSCLVSPGGVLSSFLEINERGTSAAGVCPFFVNEKPIERDSGNASSMIEPIVNNTDFVANPPSSIEPLDENIDFVANRPFFFFIRDNLFRRMLFSGALIDPLGLP